MATEINVKIPPIAQAQPKPAAQPAPAPPKDLPQKPASRTSWVMGVDPEPADTIRVPESKPDVLVFIKTKDGYQKAMEIDKGGDSLFGTGPIAAEFTEILSEAISQKLSVTCKAAPGGGSVSALNALTENLAYMRDQMDQKRKQDEFAMILLGISLAAAVIITIVYLVIGKIQGRRR